MASTAQKVVKTFYGTGTRRTFLKGDNLHAAARALYIKNKPIFDKKGMKDADAIKQLCGELELRFDRREITHDVTAGGYRKTTRKERGKMRQVRVAKGFRGERYTPRPYPGRRHRLPAVA